MGLRGRLAATHHVEVAAPRLRRGVAMTGGNYTTVNSSGTRVIFRGPFLVMRMVSPTIRPVSRRQRGLWRSMLVPKHMFSSSATQGIRARPCSGQIPFLPPKTVVGN